MKWILFFIFTGSTGSGPTHVAMHSLQFDDRASCERAAPVIDDMTRRHRVFGQGLIWQCLPASELSLK